MKFGDPIVKANCCLLGHTGYNVHTQNFLDRLRDLVDVRIRNYTTDTEIFPGNHIPTRGNRVDTQLRVGGYITQNLVDSLYIQTDGNLNNFLFKDGFDDYPERSVYLVFASVNHPFFFEPIRRPVIAYFAWESTRVDDGFLQKLNQFDAVWVPSRWQRECLIAQGLNAPIAVVPEGVDTNRFRLTQAIRSDRFVFTIVGRWEKRKSTEEIVRAFFDTFRRNEKVELRLLADNPFSTDKKTTQQRIEELGVDDRVKAFASVSHDEYPRFLSDTHCFVSCSRGEGWFLPLSESLAMGIPSIYSRVGGQLEYTNGGEIGFSVGSSTTSLEGFPGLMQEPDFDELRYLMRHVRDNYSKCKEKAMREAVSFRKDWAWENAAVIAEREIREIADGFESSQPSWFYPAFSPDKLVNLREVYERDPNYTLENSDARNGWLSSVDARNPDFLIGPATGYQEIFVRDYYSFGPCRVDHGDVVLDIGANIGMFSAYAAAKGASKIYAVEAEQTNFSVLQKNRPDNCTAFNVAICDHISEIDLSIDHCDGGHRVGGGASKTGKAQRVTGITLKGFLSLVGVDQVDFLKIDIEGQEIAALNSLSDDDFARIKKIALEYHTVYLGKQPADDLVTKLTNLGFCAHIGPLSGSLQMMYFWQKDLSFSVFDGTDTVRVDFVDGAGIAIDGARKTEYLVDFYDKEQKVFTTDIHTGCWAKTSRKWFTDWRVVVTRKSDGCVIRDERINLNGKRVFINLESKSLGDSIAWSPYLEEFRLRHGCHVICSTYWNSLFEKTYPQIEFVSPGSTAHNIVAQYKIGGFGLNGTNNPDPDRNPRPWMSTPLQEVATDILGLPPNRIAPTIHCPDSEKWASAEPYVAIATQTTMQCKFWNYPDGWRLLGEYLVSNGLKVYNGSPRAPIIPGVEPRGDAPITETMAMIKHCKFFIGLNSGLAWVAWALKRPVAMIHGISYPWKEFDCIHIQNTGVCHGCLAHHELNLGNWKGDWNWCPKHKDTPRQFECSKTITPEMVINAIQPLLS